MTDWFNVDYVELLAANPYNYAGTDGFLGNAYYHCNDEDKAYDHGVKVSSLCMDSLIVNGNGNYIDLSASPRAVSPHLHNKVLLPLFSDFSAGSPLLGL